MTVPLELLNALPAPEAAGHFRACCGASRWVEAMVRGRPYGSARALLEAAERAWHDAGPGDWDEAFRHHPRIGEARPADAASPQAARWSEGEQTGVARADDLVRRALADGNAAYERKFGRIFLVAAAGRSAEDLLAELHRRLANDPDAELRNAVQEQGRITRLRLLKLLGAPP